MKRGIGPVLAVVLAGCTPAQAQETPSNPPIIESTLPAPPAPPPALVLRRDTPVELMAPSEVRSDRAPPGTRFKLRVNKPVVVDGVTLIPVGTMGWGEVISASGSGGLGKSGLLSAKLLHIDLNGQPIPMEGETSAKGVGAGSAGLAVVFSGVAGLFHRGNNAKIKAGEIITGFVGRDLAFDPATRAMLVQP